MKLRTKLFLTFSILATVPLLLFTIFCYQRYTQTTYERIDVISSHLFENARNAANNTLDTILAIDSMAKPLPIESRFILSSPVFKL